MSSPQQIDGITAGAMVVIAGLFDGAQMLVTLLAFIPFLGPAIVIIVNPFIDFVASIVFGIWFKHFDIGLLESERVFGFVLTFFAEAIPGFDFFPWWVIFVIFTIRRERRRETVI